MKTIENSTNVLQLPPGVKKLALAAAIVSLTACDANTLDALQDNLANGEEVNLNLSTNDDGNLVIGVDDGGNDGVTSDDGANAPAALYDEAFDGEITDDATNPLALDLQNGSNVINGSVVVDDIDYVTVNVPAGHVLSALELVNFESTDDLSFIGIQEGTVFTEPPTGTIVANLLGFTLIGPDVEGTDILPNIGAGEGAQGFTGSLAAGDYTFWIQQTGPEPVDYSFDLVVSPVEDIPAAGSVTVTLTNTSESQPMTPPVVVLHNAPGAQNGLRLFYPGQPATPEIIAIAENGNNGPMIGVLGYLTDQGRASTYAVGFADPANPGPLLPGMTASVELDLVSDDQVMSVVSMVVCTNDAFSGVDSHTLSSDTSETILAPIFDAGSETNVLNVDYWVPPCGSATNMTDDENGSVTPHPGQSGSENPGFDFESGTRYLEVSITRN